MSYNNDSPIAYARLSIVVDSHTDNRRLFLARSNTPES
jgi:hypothetical protein